MRKLSGLILFVVILVVIGVFFRQKLNKDLSQAVIIPSATPTAALKSKNIRSGPVRDAVFVPYWSTYSDLAGDEVYDRYIYFGAAPGTKGIILQKDDISNIQKFTDSAPSGSKKLLTIRMIGNDLNTQILDSNSVQEKVIADSISIAKDFGFDGLVLDLELSAIPFDSLVNRISGFIGKFYRASKESDLSFSLAVYGDVFYRARPFDMKKLSEYADEVMIMAYDFHKANGNPGPNFPLKGAGRYGYDYLALASDYLEIFSPGKLTVIFGMYGYDWVVDENGKSQGEAEALSYNEIRKRFLDECGFEECVRGRDSLSGEAYVKYVDSDGERHVVWYEDRESVERKREFLEGVGIRSFSYWAYGYF